MSISEANLTKLCNALRVSATETSQAEITDLAEAAMIDLSRQGVDTVDLDDPLTFQAVKLYCKANYGYDKDTARFDLSYASLSAAMALSGDYTDDEEDDDESSETSEESDGE